MATESEISDEQLGELEESADAYRVWSRDNQLAVITEIRRQIGLIEGLKPLARLGVKAVKVSRTGLNFDSADIHDTAIELGVLIETALDPARDEDTGIGFEPGETYFEFTPEVLAAKRALEVEE